MAGKEKKSYVILRPDGLLLHTKPITGEEARWLYDAYRFVKPEAAKIQYLEEWGNVLDVSEQVERLRQLLRSSGRLRDILGRVLGIYHDPEEFEKRIKQVLGYERLQGLPEARQTLEDLLSKAGDFLRRPVEPKPIRFPPVRGYVVDGPHVMPDGQTVPDALWYAYVSHPEDRDLLYGVSIFDDAFWLWKQDPSIFATSGVLVRRDATDEEVANAVANDERVRKFLVQYANWFKKVIDEHEAELVNAGYEDVVRKARQLLALAERLGAKLHESEEEKVPA